jgi:flagellin-like hook-associated protein FlgL
MRVTQSLLLRHQSAGIAAAYARLFDVGGQISSGRRLLQPSDDPGSIRPALDVRSGRARLAQAKENAGFALGELGQAEGTLRSMSELVTRARELAIEGANGSLGQADRDGVAQEVDALLAQLVTLANARGATGYLFAGGRKDAAPYELLATADGDVVRYRGDGAVTSVDLGDSNRVDLNLPGASLFGLGARGAAIWTAVTGAAAGQGNDSARGSDHLTVAHSRTVLGDGALAGTGGTGDSLSGLRIGAGSAAGDTVLGSGVWSLALNDTSGTGASGTVSLNGGPTVNWTSSDGDLVVAAPTGELVHLDLTSVTAGFVGTVALAGEGTLSLDGGLTTTPIDFSSASQIVADSQTGGSLFVDSRAIVRTGVDVVRHPGAYDLFAALVELRDSLRNVDGQALDVQLGRIRGAIAELDGGEQLMLNGLAALGARMRLAESIVARAEEFDVVLADRQSTLEDTDLAAASTELAQAQLTLQAGVSLTSRIAQLPSLVQLL